jgi:hypothetical protein
MATIAVTPQLSEPGGTDVIISAPQLEPIDRGLLGALAVAAGGLIVWIIASSKGAQDTRRLAAEVAAMSAGFGVMTGYGYRVVTAKSVGANIGGGLVILAAPVVGLLFIGYLIARVQRVRKRSSGNPGE